MNNNKLNLADVNWHLLVENSKLQDLEHIDVTDNGKPLLQIIIDNENEQTGEW